MPLHKTVYQRAWEKDFDWLASSEEGVHKGLCKICNKHFSIDNSGKCQVKQHASKDSHRKKEGIIKGQTSQSTFNKSANGNLCLVSKGLNIPLTSQQRIQKAETIQALHVVQDNLSFSQCADDGERFCLQFPDSEIAKGYSQGASKVKYNIEYGIAPYLHNQLKDDFQGVPFTFKYDEATTSQVKKQFDGYVQFWSSTYNKIICCYIGSIFVGHCTADDTVKHFHEFGKTMNWNTDLLLHLGHDGPNINLSFEKKLQDDIKSDILKLGTCSLHHVHNAFRAGLKKLSSFDVDLFINDASYFFKLSSARREDYKLAEELTDISARMMIRHTSTRWVTMKKSCLRLLEQWPNLCEYFLKFLPSQKNFRSIANTDRYKRIAAVLEQPIFKAYLCFIAFTAQQFEHFLIQFQSANSKVCYLYSSMGSLLYGLLTEFVKQQKLLSVENKPLDAKSLSQIDSSSKENQKKKKNMGIGTRAKVVLSEADAQISQDRKATFLNECQEFYVNSTSYLQSHLPVQSSIIKDVQYLLPQKRTDTQGHLAVSRLSLSIGSVLGKHLCHSFSVKSGTNLEDICDMVRQQWMLYQIEDIPQEWFNKKDLREGSSKESYWKRVSREWIGESCDDEHSGLGDSQVPVDEYWFKIGQIKSDDGFLKYPQLFALAKCCLTLSHGNAAPERGFSINKNILQVHGTSLSESTLIALRRVKESLILHGGELNIPITKSLLKSVENSYSKYKADMEIRKQAEEAECRRKEEQTKAEQNLKRKAEVNSQLEELEEEIQVSCSSVVIHYISK